MDILLVANTAQANAALAKTQGQLAATGKTATATSATMKKALLGVGVAAGAAGAALFKIGEDFDDAYDTIRTRTGATGKEMKRLQNSFRNVVGSMPTDFDTAAKAVSGLNQRLDLTGKPLQRLSKQVIALAKITGTDIDTNVRSITRLFGDWSVATEKQEKTLDRLYRLTQDTGVGFTDLADLMVQFGAPLRSLGFSFDEAAAMFARFEKEGVNIQTLMPGLRMGLKNLSIPSDELAAKMKDLGIAMNDPEQGLQDILRLFLSGDLKKADQTFVSSAVFGGRAWTDMSRAIEEGRFDFDKLIETMRQGEGTIRGDERATRDLAEWMTVLGNRIKTKLEPVARDVFEGMADLIRDVANAFKEGGLTSVIDLLAQKLQDAAPKIAEAGLKIGGALIKGIWDAFWGTSLLGKLLIGGAIYKLLGGKAAIASAGRAVGFAFAHPMALAIGLTMASFAAGWEFGKDSFVTQTKKGDEAIQAVADDLGITFDRARKLQRFLQNNPGLGINEAMEATKTPFELATQLDISMNKAKKLRDWMRSNPGLSAPDALKSMNTAARFTRNLWEDASNSIREESKRTGDTMMQVFARATGKVIGDFVNTKNKGKDSTFDLAKGVAMNIGSLAGAVGAGMANVKENTNKSLGAFGVDTLNYAIKKVGNLLSGAQKKQTGGVIVPGQGSGDKVPAMLEPGEVVLNKKAVAAMGGASNANAVNQLIPRFQAGGVAGLQPGISRLVKWAAQKYGLRVSSGLRPGDAGSYHSKGWAADLIPPSMGATKGIFGAFKNQLAELFYDPWGGYDSGQMIGPIGNHMDHIHAAIIGSGSGGPMAARVKRLLLDGPKGPLRDMGQGALDKVRKAANSYLSKNSMTSHGNIGNISGPLQAIAQKLIAAQWGKGQWPPFNELVMRESGWDPTAVNPSSGAAGLAQALPPSKYPAGAWPYKGKSSAVKQLQWMISYIAGRYGTPSAALGWHDSHNWYKQGGVVGAQKGVVAPGGRGATGKGSSSTIPSQLLKRLKQLRKLASTLDERILIAETRGAFPGSEAGSDLGPTELAGLANKGGTGLYNKLLNSLTTRAATLRYILKTVPKGKRTKGLRDELVELQGVTGGAGRILETQATINDLLGQGVVTPDTGPRLDLLSEMLRQANLRYAVSQAQYGVFAGGGVAPPMVTPTVTPTVGNADVAIYDYGGGNREVSVNGKMMDPRKVVQAGSRHAGRRPLPSSRGY